jgi:LmbE family N-acetylglucosaminyl deacetylase
MRTRHRPFTAEESTGSVVDGTILSVWAHPDDETYLAGGMMAAATDRGQRVVCVSATSGERGTDDPLGWPPSRLGRVRRWEAAAAMAVLGVSDHRLLGLPDGALAEHDQQGQDLIGGLLDEVRPDTILTFGPDGMTFHPDHITVSRWVTAAWRQRGCPGRLLYATSTAEHLDRFGEIYEEWDAYMTDERPSGVPSVDLAVHLLLDDWRLDRKLTALRALASQTGDLMARLDPAVYAQQIAEEAFIDAPRSARPVEGRAPVSAAGAGPLID